MLGFLKDMTVLSATGQGPSLAIVSLTALRPNEMWAFRSMSGHPMINFLRVKLLLWVGGKQKAEQGVEKCRFQSGLLLRTSWVAISNSLNL